MATKKGNTNTAKAASIAEISKQQNVDGRAAAIQLLHGLQKMNWKRDAPAKSLRTIKAAIKCAGTFPGKEFDRFLRVISEWLVTELLGMGLDLGEYEALKKGAHHG